MLKVRIFQPKFNYGIATIRKFSSLQPQLNNTKIQTVICADKFETLNQFSIKRHLSISVQRFSSEGATGAGSVKEVKEELIFKVPDKPAVPSGGEAVEAVSSSNNVVFTLPEKPSPVDVSQLGEASFESLGLASWWPSGRMQYFLENLHIGLGLEWYQSIILATLCMRLVMFPFMVMAQKNMANMNNNMPAMSALQEKISDARRRGDLFEMAQLTQELQTLSNKKGINPFKNMIPMGAQLPVFMSFFFGLRGMTNCPVESMSTGGILWFENLTVTDPFYLLPLMTCCTTYLQFRTGAEGARLDMMSPKMKIAMTVLPFCLFPVTMNFAAAVTFYWFNTNLISLAQAKMFKQKKVRKFFGIPMMIEHKKPPEPKGKKKGFRETVRDTVDNFRASAKIIDRRAYDEQMFREAGRAKPVKTYDYDPTKIASRKQ